MPHICVNSFFFFFNDTATTEIYTLSLHDALPISLRGDLRLMRTPQSIFVRGRLETSVAVEGNRCLEEFETPLDVDRKSTRLNSSHANISYAVFCLKKKPPQRRQRPRARLHQPVLD